MMKSIDVNRRASLFLLIALSMSQTHGAPFGTAFNYQGRLTVGTNASNGIYDFQFSLWDGVGSGATLIGATQGVNNVTVNDGMFAATIDFGAGAFNGEARWLEVAVRTNRAASLDVLSPRQNLLPTPYAMTASNLSGTLSAGQLTGTLPPGLISGIYSSAVTLTNPANVFSGNGVGLTGVNASTLGGYGVCALPCYWNLTGNSGTTSGIHFVGTTDNQPLELKVNGQRAFRLEPTTNGPNIIGGYSGNFVTNIAFGATIVGGGGNGLANSITASHPIYGAVLSPIFATISGGGGNQIAASPYASIGGGAKNQIINYPEYYSTSYSVIGGGASNSITDVIGCTIAGGVGNVIIGDIFGGGHPFYSTIGGGQNNTINDEGEYSYWGTIAGGVGNYLRRARGASIGGGEGNSIKTDAYRSTISGGSGNSIKEVSPYGAIAGGFYNVIDVFVSGASIGGGISNHVIGNQGSPVPSCATIPGGQNNTATNLAFAAGYRAKAINSGAFVWADYNEFDFPSTDANSFSVRAVGGTRFVSGIDGVGNPTAAVVLKPGDGSWTSLSDRNAKENIKSVSGREVLQQLDSVPIATWNYKSQDKSIRHIGPMAQDFAAAFKVGEDEHGISTVDADGVALAAIQGLHEALKEKDARIESLERDVAQLKLLVNALANKSNDSPK